jgi:predicted Zn-dependent peptidase
MFDRTLAPAFQTIQSITIPKAVTHRLDNGLLLHVVNVGEQPLVRVEFIFQAGTWYEPARAVSMFTTKMMNEGTSTRSSREIHEYVDQFGSFIEFNHGTDKITLTVYALVKYLPEVLVLISDLLQDSIFPGQELDNLKNITRQTLKVNLEKNAYVANAHFRSALFGENHPYGKSLREEDIDPIEPEMLKEYYRSRIQGRAFDIIMAGKVGDQEIAFVNRYLGQLDVSQPAEMAPAAASIIPTFTPILVEKEDSLQSTIRLGRRLFPRRNPDYPRLSVLNEVLGGYFGSRLMKNIREDKGFTYGISSNLAAFQREGYWMIGTDVKREFTRETLEEIDKEMRLLQTEPIDAFELETVRNYMIGSFAGSLNTAFDIADRFKITYFEGLPIDYYDHYIERVQSVSVQELMELAHTYLNRSEFQEVVVGGM